jgi:hypothetical protein
MQNPKAKNQFNQLVKDLLPIVIVESKIQILNNEVTEKRFFKTSFGDVPITKTVKGNTVFTEDYNNVVQHHFADKTNWRGDQKLSIEERIDLKNAIKSHPDRNHKPTMFNQIIKLQ